ncbi:hypothetical protein HOLleu_09312 [Holothuria leucospilota]|uniref:WAP domain-containing protein n=1 Tax=Holothuria leucospilota TaxID=206669 RepID=A0A9Q1HGX3_HOLLE|nr:hypothetical protein HOLleu_09312 [Holothuria leucospilota]
MEPYDFTTTTIVILQAFTRYKTLMKSPLFDFTMSNVQMRKLILAAVPIGLILLGAGLCSSQDPGDRFTLPVVCKETDAPRIFQEEGSLYCWKCECFDDKHWGCFQASGNCSNAVPPIVEFRTCETTTCDDIGICFSYGTGDLWVEPTNELCWCDDGDSKCNIDSALASNKTKDFSNLLDYRNSGTVCVKDEKLVLNFGDAVLTNCSICTCINESFWCSEIEDCEKELFQLACPLVVSEDCQQPIRELCTNDSQCKGNTKCCLRGCVRQCEEAVPADNCEEGHDMVPCTFFNPCEFTRCPKHPEARCRISHCGTCHAQYFVDNIRVNCFEDDVCDIDTPLLPCFLDDSCAFLHFHQACPAASQAECRLNYCGSCFYEFFNASGNKVACHAGDPCPVGVQEFDCEHTCAYNNFCPGAGDANVSCVPSKCGGCGFPKFYYDNGTEVQCFDLEGNCPEGSVSPSTCTDYCNDPAFSCTNPDVVSCQINYCGGKCTGEYFNSKGERVSCFGGRPCPPGQQETPFCPSDCSATACLAYPNAVCEIDSCDFRCDEVFYNSDTNTPVNCSEGYTCPEENPVSPFCTDVFSDFLFLGCFARSCDRNPEAKCFDSPCGFCHTEFYIDQERVNCYGDIPCPQGIAENANCENVCGTTAYCPADLSAICLMDQCNGRCETVFQDLEGNIIEDCFEGVQCPTGEVDALCPYNLCESETCETHPEAECRLNHCGTCRAQFFLPNGTEITNCSTISCPADMALLFCGDICSGIVCTNYPNATCSVNNCGKCKLEFFSPDGIHLSAEDCGVSEREGFCPAEFFHPTLPMDCETDGDCIFPLKCCSNIPGIDFIKFCTTPLEVNPYSCEYEGVRYDPHAIRLEECELCTCLLGRWACYDTKCNLTCAVDNIANCDAGNCNPMEKLCPAYPDARCTTNPCGGCTVEHLLNDMVVDCYDADLLECPEGETPVACEFNPCPPSCETYPDAICRVNVCGSCKAEHVFDNRTVDCNERPRCFYMGQEYTDILEIRISEEACNLCICVRFNHSICLSLGGPCPDPLPCEENGVEYPPLFRRRENCTECVCSEVISGKFGCFEIPNCVDYEKEGVCPPKQGSPNECFEEVIHECDHDGNCTGHNKCCHEYCGSICETPVPEGPACFSCISYFSDDIPNTGDVCSDVAVPNVDVVKCITGMMCASIRAEATFNVLGPDAGVTRSITVVQRGCFWPENISQNTSGCIKGNDTTLPRVYDETEEWILQHEGKALIKEFSVSACFCEEHNCNSVVLPLPQATSQPFLSTTITEESNSLTTTFLTPSSSNTSKASTKTTVQGTTQQTISTTEETPPSITTSLKTSWPSTASYATSTQIPMTETTLQPVYTTTTPGTTSSKGTSPRMSSPSPASGAATTQFTMKETTTGVISTKTSSTLTDSRGNACTLQGEPSNQRSFQSNPCSNCVCVDGFFLCRFNGTCLADGVVEEVLYTLTGDFTDIAGMENQFGRTLIQNLARELMIDETVFLNIKLSAGSVKVKQNVTDSKSVDVSAKEISKQIREKVDMGMFSFTFNGKNYTSVSGTFEVSQSYQFSSTSSGISAGVVAVIVTAVIVVISLLMVVFIVVYRTWRKGQIDTETAVLLRLSRSPSLNSDKIGPVEFENPIYNN